MLQSNSVFLNRRVILISMVIVAIAVGFWSSSRYPSLQGKADMTGTFKLEDTLTHGAKTVIKPDGPFYQKVAYTTVNWA